MATLSHFNAAGDLPPGIHQSSLAQVLQRFGDGSAQRRTVAERLSRVHKLAVETGHVTRFILFGSFITAASAPNDVDVFLLMDDNFAVEELRGEAAILFNPLFAQSCF